MNGTTRSIGSTEFHAPAPVVRAEPRGQRPSFYAVAVADLFAVIMVAVAVWQHLHHLPALWAVVDAILFGVGGQVFAAVIILSSWWVRRQDAKLRRELNLPVKR